jgi:hypothetical protein
VKRATDHVSIRLDAATIARLDALAPRIAPAGAKPVRAIATRACILAGLDVIEKQLVAKGTP